MTKQVIDSVIFAEENGINIAQVAEGAEQPTHAYISLHQNALPAVVRASKAILNGELPEAIVTVPHIAAGQMIMGIIPDADVEDMPLSLYDEVFDYSFFDDEEGETLNRRLAIGFTDDFVFFGDNSTECVESFEELAANSQDEPQALASGLVIDRKLLPELIEHLEGRIEELGL